MPAVLERPAISGRTAAWLNAIFTKRATLESYWRSGGRVMKRFEFIVRARPTIVFDHAIGGLTAFRDADSILATELGSSRNTFSEADSISAVTGDIAK
jgi:hypothetical protein